jgi:hypothetical protein
VVVELPVNPELVPLLLLVDELLFPVAPVFVPPLSAELLFEVESPELVSELAPGFVPAVK